MIHRIERNTVRRSKSCTKFRSLQVTKLCLLTGVLMFSQSALLQEQEEEGSEEEAVVFRGTQEAEESFEDLTVVGTLIKGASIDDQPYATTYMSRESLKDQGSLMLVDVLKQLSTTTGTLGDRNGWYNHNQPNVVPENYTSVNLRGLGPSRTLVLINGKRHVYVPVQLFGGRFVDVNSFPSIAIESVQIQKEGASAIYGSDAVAGVTNFLTRSDFEGFEALINIEAYDGANNRSLGFIWGQEFETLHMVASYERSERSGLFASDRAEFVLRPFSGDGGWSFWGNPGAFIVPSEPLPTDVEGFVLALQQLPHFIDPECENFGGHIEFYPNYPEFNTCRFRYAQYDKVVDQTNHNRIFVEASGTIDDQTDWRVEFLWAQAEVVDWLTTPSFPPRSLFDGTYQIAPTHPGRQSFCDSYGSVISECANTQDWYFYGRLAGNSGPGRTFGRDSDNVRLAGSISGQFEWGELEPDYEIAFAYSSGTSYFESGAEYAYRKFLAYRGFGGPRCGVGIVADPNSPSLMRLGEVPTGVEPGEGNCLYYNPFSNALPRSDQWGSHYSTQPNPNHDPAVANSREVLDWIFETVVQESTADLFVLDGMITGNLIPDTLDFAAGYQFRLFEVSSDPNDVGDLSVNPCYVPGDRSCVVPTGLFTFTLGTYPYERDQSMNRLFGELAWTVNSKTLVQLALNVESYEHATSVDPKVALRYDLNENLSLRTSLQTTFRTPSVDDLNTQPFTVLDYVAQADVYKAIDIFGSEDLDPESAFTYNVGIIGNAYDWDFAVDFWSYAFDGLIGPIPHAAITRLYVDEAKWQLVRHLIRCPGGVDQCSGVSIERVRVDLVNWPGVETFGYDFHVSRTWFTDSGEFTWKGEGTYINSYLVQGLVAFGEQIVEERERAGYLNQESPVAPPMPQVQWRTSLAWDRDEYRFVTYLNYVSSYNDQTESDSEYYEIDPYLTLDANLNWKFEDLGLNVNVGMLNIFDEPPPAVNWEVGYDGFTHDPRGRRLKLVLSYTY